MKSWQTESSEAKLQKQINKSKKRNKQTKQTRGKAVEHASVEYALSSTPVTETCSQFQ